MDFKVTHVVNELTNAEISALIDHSLAKYPELQALGIAVSNALHKRGIAGKHKNIPIAMDESLYPEDAVVIVFDKD